MQRTTPTTPEPREPRSGRRLLAGLSVALAALLLVPVVWAVGGRDRQLPDGSAAVEGVLSTWHGDGVAGVIGEGAEIQTPDGVVPVRMAMGEARRLSGKRLRVRGTVRSGVLLADGGAGTTVVADAAVAAAPATRTVAVILLTFSDNTAQPWTPAAVEDTVLDADRSNPLSVRAFYEESSDGAVTLGGKVLGWYPIADTDDGCDYRNWAALGRAAATADASAAGIDLASASVSKVYVFPRTPNCGWAGLGELPGDEAWADGYATLRVIAHELGHNFGVHHASTSSCVAAGGLRTAITARVADDCSLSEYGDPFTVMGSSTRSHHAWQRAQLGYPVVSQVIAPTAGYDASHVLTALEPGTGSTAVRLLRIQRGATGTYLDLELRGASAPVDGFAATDPAVTGVSARIGYPSSSRTQSQLLDGTLGTTAFSDAPLAPGGSLWDPVAGARVTVQSVSGGTATVRVQSDPDGAAPSGPGAPSATSTAGTLPSVTLTWTAATDDRLLAGYEIRRGGARVGVAKGLSFTDACVSGQACGLTVGASVTYDVVPYDAAGKLGPKGTVTLTVGGSGTGTGGGTGGGDSTAPSAPGAPSVTDVTAGSVALTWVAATDEVGGSGVARYEVYRGTTLAGTATTTGFTDTGVTPATAYAYTVRALDVAGNRSLPSPLTTVTTEPVPGVPAVTATTVSGRTVTVTYGRVDAYAAYEVRRETLDSRTGAWGSAVTVASPGVCGAATCSVAMRVSRGTYRYSLRARNGTLLSAWGTPGPQVTVRR